jgi:hypothetical protein
MDDSKHDRRDWLDEWRADLTARTEALGSGALDFTDSPEDVARKANGQASEMAQEWADWWHDSEAQWLADTEEPHPTPEAT